MVLKIVKSLVNRTALATSVFVNPKKGGYAHPDWLSGRETFELNPDSPAGIFKNLYEFEITANVREWKQLLFYNEMVDKIRDVPGDIAEFGVSGGVSLMCFTRLVDTYENGLDHKEKRRIYGFDSFEGLPELGSHDISKVAENAHMKKGGFVDDIGFQYLLNFVSKHSNVQLRKGWFSQTLPVFLEENPAVSFALVHIDCDLYESTMDVLTRVWNHVTPGGMVLFDELFHKDFPGETRAFREFFDARKGEFTIHKSKIKPDKKFIIKT